MKVLPLVPRSPAAIRDALARRGMETARAEEVARGVSPAAVLCLEVPPDLERSLADAARLHGIDCVSGTGWVLFAGAVSRLAGIVRPGPGISLPSTLSEPLGRILSALTAPPRRWTMARGEVVLDRPLVVGILNVTPDSFSDGGRYRAPDAAVARADVLLDEGADMLDVGAESTRPGRPAPVPASEEWRRLAPVLREISRRFPQVPVSVDTVKAEIARRSLEAGVWAINDVSGLRLDPSLGGVCAAAGAGLVLMHSRGTVEEMAEYAHARYDDVTASILQELDTAVRRAEAAGVDRERLVLDPGLGFSKTPEQTCEAFRAVPSLAALGRPVMIGPSRKRFLGVLTGRPVGDRDRATAAACAVGYQLGASLFRVHAAAAAREALDVARGVGRG